jgi:ABC-2 type transport system ATP-binding protein
MNSNNGVKIDDPNVGTARIPLRAGNTAGNEPELRYSRPMPQQHAQRDPAALDIRGLSLRFGDIVAVDVIDCEIFGLLGANGAGKSTTIKMLTTLLPPTSGTALVAGFDIRAAPRRVRRRIGYVPQMVSADGALTGYENLLLAARLHDLTGREQSARIADALEFMELAPAARRLVRTYSGGMIRRLELAQEMLHRPEILFLDEPTIGLDPVARHTVWERLARLNHDYHMTILLTTHDMEEADHLCSDIAILRAGRIAARGRPAELKAAISADATLDDVFAHYSSMNDSGRLRDTAETRDVAQRLG